MVTALTMGINAVHHDVLLRAPRELDRAFNTRPKNVSGAPAILQREDDDFIEATLEELRSAESRSALAGDLADTRNSGVLKLFQPMQRQFHLAVMEAFCDIPGVPRVDPKKIESAGMVLRRVRNNGRREAWMRATGEIRGWLPVQDEAESDPRHDPNPQLRLARHAIGPASLARQLVAQAAQRPGALLSEHVIPMFVAPPDVCAEARRTLYYGIIPTTSSELSSAPAQMPSGFGPSSQAFRDHLVGGLRGEAMDFTRAGQTVQPTWRIEGDIPMGDAGHNALLNKFILLLRQIAIEFDAFGESAASKALFAELQTISLPLVTHGPHHHPRGVTAGSFLKACVPVLLERDANAPRPEMPKSWPALDANARGRLANALSAGMLERFKSIQPRAGRYDRPGARYQLRAFVRLKPEGPCPARTVWSDYSEAFTIAPWYESTGSAPVQIPLPDLTRDTLKALKPNVAFVVPPSIANLLNSDPKKLSDGEGEEPNPMGIQWICSFSLPIITICAFIVLNIFLGLFDLFLKWMMFIKICVPFPKSGGDE
jgi:hypothetical protein